jgi:hypothetical protein
MDTGDNREIHTGGPATITTAVSWKVGGSRGDESAVCLSRCTDIVGVGGGIEECILSRVCIVGGADHAIRQTVYILGSMRIKGERAQGLRCKYLFVFHPATIRIHGCEGIGRRRGV